VVEAGTRIIDPAAANTPFYGSAGTNWEWLAWLYDRNPTAAANATDLSAFTSTPTNPLIFRNIRDVELAREGTQMYLTVTCEQFAGRLANISATNAPHYLAAQGAGVFEYCIDISGAAGAWARFPAANDGTATLLGNAYPTVSGDDPMWWFTRLNYMYVNTSPASPTRRTLTNIEYKDKDGTDHWLGMGWSPVSAIRLPTDRRPVNGHRLARHLVTNAAQIVQNLSRDNVNDEVAPASLFSSVFVVSTDDLNDAAPNNDIHDLSRAEVIPDPADADWTDPFNQPTFADRR
jgi:hypothetical protein